MSAPNYHRPNPVNVLMPGGGATTTTTVERCVDDGPQDYLVCVTVHKASFAGRPNDDTFVAIELVGQSARQTPTYPRSETPVFDEYMVFELHEPLNTVLRKSVRVSAYRKTCCAKRNECFGEAMIELHTVWAMESRFSEWKN